MPILSHVCLRAEESGLVMEATNLEIGIRQVLGAKVEVEGEITVPVRTLMDLVGNLSSGPVTLEAEGMKLTVSCGGARATVNGGSASEFPSLPRLEDSGQLSMPAGELARIIEQVGFAAAIDESRPVLTGVLMKFSDKGIEFVGTDGFRLSQVIWSCKAGWKENRELLVPAKSMAEVGRLLHEEVETVHLSMVENGNQVVFGFGSVDQYVAEVEVSSRLISGSYPDYKKIMPDAGETVMRVGTSELTRAVKLASVFARESANIIKLLITENQVTVSANAPQVGDNEAKIQAEVEGPGGGVAFNYRYVLDYLQVVGSDEVSLEMNGPLSPGLWKISGKTKGAAEFKHVIMPMRLEEE